MELAVVYSLVGPDGTRVVTGNSDDARADPDWVGYLNPDEGITGLDAPDLRESAAEIIAGDGGIHYDFFHGRRPVAISGSIWPEGRDPATVNQLEQKLKRATNAMRADALLRWQNTGYPLRRLALRRQQPPRITGRRPKAFQLAMVSADYRILSDVENATSARSLNDGTNAASMVETIVAAGDETATPRWEVQGPAGSAVAPISLFSNLPNLYIRFKSSFAISLDQLLVVDTAPPYPRVTVNGVDRYDAVDYLGTDWFGLPPGQQTVTVFAAGAGSWRLYWRDAWT